MGDFKVDKTEDGLLMVIQRQSTNRSDQERDIGNLKKRILIKHPHLLHLKYHKAEEKSTWCSKHYFIIAAYEYYERNLQKEILKRRRVRQFFSPLELLRMIYDSIDVLAFLQNNKISHGEINPTLMYLYEDEIEGYDRVKICERLSGSADSKINNLNALNNNIDIYLDPSKFESTSKAKRSDIEISQFK